MKSPNGQKPKTMLAPLPVITKNNCPTKSNEIKKYVSSLGDCLALCAVK